MNESVIEVRFERPKDIDEVRLLNDKAVQGRNILLSGSCFFCQEFADRRVCSVGHSNLLAL